MSRRLAVIVADMDYAEKVVAVCPLDQVEQARQTHEALISEYNAALARRGREQLGSTIVAACASCEAGRRPGCSLRECRPHASRGARPNGKGVVYVGVSR